MAKPQGAEKTVKLIIAEDSCNGEEQSFEKWMNETHPEIETRIGNTLDGGAYDVNGDLVENENFWEAYCSQ